eukprot:434433-Amphidinium_carterae.2
MPGCGGRSNACARKPSPLSQDADAAQCCARSRTNYNIGKLYQGLAFGVSTSWEKWRPLLLLLLSAHHHKLKQATGSFQSNIAGEAPQQPSLRAR